MRNKQLTQEEAEAKAKELWGQSAFAIVAGPSQYLVGEAEGPFRHFYGLGHSWECAFKNAHRSLN